MREQYSWITELTELLDGLENPQTDYEEAAKLKKILSLVNKEVKRDADALTHCDEGSYINMIKSEIADATYEYIQGYIKKHRISTDDFHVSRGEFNGKVLLSVVFDAKDKNTINTHNLPYLVTHINNRDIIKDMTGIEYSNDYWATPVIYKAFQEAKAKDPDWIVKYSTEIKEALDNIKKRPSRRKK